MGVIEVDPKEFLVNGIKNEMVIAVCSTLHRSLIFKKDLTMDMFDAAIKQVSVRLDNMRTAMEYIQDLIGIDALNIWMEQMTRIIDFNVNREANAKEIQKTRMIKEGKEKNLIEIPVYEPVDGCLTFLGRLINVLVNITSPAKPLYYIPGSNGWYDPNGVHVFGPKTIGSLIKAFGVVGVNGLDKLISYNINREISSLGRTYKKQMDTGSKTVVEAVRKELKGYNNDLTEALKNSFDKNLDLLANTIKIITASLERIGHYQLMRKIILSVIVVHFTLFISILITFLK
jgi:WASH complex subunit strumpellin